MNAFRRLISGVVFLVLVIASVVLAVLGAELLRLETAGVGAICVAVFIAVLARICQAADHHAELCRLLDRKPASATPERSGT